MTYRVCFVCTGNICRSPMAESVFRARVAKAGLDGLVEVDSAGTDGWHEGEGADPRHLGELRRLAPTQGDADKVRLLRSYDPDAGDDLDVPDPYYGGADGFDECLEMVEAASTGLLAAVREQVEGRPA